MSAMPLPTPRAVICQASQVTKQRAGGERQDRHEAERRAGFNDQVVHALEAAGDAVGLERGDQDGERKRTALDGAAPALPGVMQRPQPRNEKLASCTRIAAER